MSELTIKQKRFCEEYIIDSNGQAAAERAGYSKKTARSQASQLLTKLNIQTYIEHLLKQVSERNRITIDELVSTLAAQARFDIGKLYDENGFLLNIHDIDEDTRKSIEEISVFQENAYENGTRVPIGETKKIKTANRQNAITTLLKFLGAFEKDNDQKKANVVVFQLPDNNR